MKNNTKKCWPWTHQWTKWKTADGTARNRITGGERDALVQTRQCEKCGFTQIEGVRGR